MPFLQHFGLRTYPFGLTPNPTLYYSTHEPESVLAALDFSISRGDGLLKITGEVGTGKTLLCRLLLANLSKRPVNTAYWSAPIDSEVDRVASVVMREFGIKHKNKNDDPGYLIHKYLLNEHARGKRCVLVIDEAQALGAKGLETVRLLSNLETETEKLLQIVLFGQTELNVLLNKPGLRQVLQRVQFGFNTSRLSREETGRYLKYRCDQCGERTGRGKNRKTCSKVTFSELASTIIWQASEGIHRTVNLVADKSLLAAYTDNSVVVKSRHVVRACSEMAGLAWPWAQINKYRQKVRQ